jgi:hypothetical protein
MKDRKKPLVHASRPEYPSTEDISDRRLFLRKLGVAGLLGGAGMLLLACDNVGDEPNLPGRMEVSDSGSDDNDTETLDDSDTPGDSESVDEPGTAVDPDTESETAGDTDEDTATDPTVSTEPQPTDDGMIMGAIE